MPRAYDFALRKRFHSIDQGPYKYKRLAYNLCDKPIPDSANKLSEHLAKCPQYLASLGQQNEELTQPGMNRYVVRMTPDDLHKHKLQAARAIFVGGRPFTLFEDPEMQQLFQ